MKWRRLCLFAVLLVGCGVAFFYVHRAIVIHRADRQQTRIAAAVIAAKELDMASAANPASCDNLIRSCDDLLSRNPSDDHLWWLRGKLFYDRWSRSHSDSDLQEAVADWRRALDLNPDNIQARNHLAAYYYKGGEYERAKIEAQRVLEVSPSNAVANAIIDAVSVNNAQSKATVQMAPSDMSKVQSLVRVAYERMEASPKDASACSDAGDVMWKLRGASSSYPTQALASWEKAVELDPNFLKAMLSLGEGYLDLSEDEKALLWYQRAYVIDPERTKQSLEALKERQAEAGRVVSERLAQLEGQQTNKTVLDKLNKLADSAQAKRLQKIAAIENSIEKQSAAGAVSGKAPN